MLGGSWFLCVLWHLVLLYWWLIFNLRVLYCDFVSFRVPRYCTMVNSYSRAFFSAYFHLFCLISSNFILRVVLMILKKLPLVLHWINLLFMNWHLSRECFCDVKLTSYSGLPVVSIHESLHLKYSHWLLQYMIELYIHSLRHHPIVRDTNAILYCKSTCGSYTEIIISPVYSSF